MSLRRGGVTLIETVTVITILVVVGAITFPLASNAKLSAKEAESLQKLRQVWMATALYQENWESGVNYGKASEMGLPTLDTLPHHWIGLTYDAFRSPCASDEANANGTGFFVWSPADEEPWPSLAIQFEAGMPLAVDAACGNTNLDPNNFYRRRRAIAVMLGGNTKKRFRDGNWRHPQWWQ